MGKGAFKPLLHCFSSGIELAERGLALGAYLSFSGILTFKTAEDIREAARIVPAGPDAGGDRCALPGASATPGQSNEPAYTAHTLAHLAEVKGVSVETNGAHHIGQFLPPVCQGRPACRLRGGCMSLT